MQWGGEMEMRGGDIFRRCCFPLQLQQLYFFSHMRGCKHIKDTQWRLCNNPSMCCVAGTHSEKWWLYVNRARAEYVSVYQVVIKSFIKQTQPYLWATSAAKFCTCRAAVFVVWCSSSFCFLCILPHSTAYRSLHLTLSFSCLSFSRPFVSETLGLTYSFLTCIEYSVSSVCVFGLRVLPPIFWASDNHNYHHQ